MSLVVAYVAKARANIGRHDRNTWHTVDHGVEVPLTPIQLTPEDPITGHGTPHHIIMSYASNISSRTYGCHPRHASDQRPKTAQQHTRHIIHNNHNDHDANNTTMLKTNTTPTTTIATPTATTTATTKQYQQQQQHIQPTTALALGILNNTSSKMTRTCARCS